MKITIVGNFGVSWDSSICDEENVAKALEAMGHTVYRFQREETREAYWKQPEADFAIISQWDGYLDDVVQRLKMFIKGPIAYWAFDHQWNPPADWHLKLAKDCDVFLTKEIDHYQDYRQMLPNTAVYWLPQDFAPDFIEPVRGDFEQDIDVLFMGTHLPGAHARIEVLKEVDKHFNMQVNSVTADQWRAEGLKNVHGPAVDGGMARLVARAKINLSVEIYESPGYWSDRNAQIMAAGGFVLYKHEPFAETTFRDNIAYFYDVKDCLEKVAYYLENTAERQIITAKGYHFARENLMATHRVKDLLAIMGRHL